ncbi:hypothetical protein [Streptomyces sp. Tu 2975]|uniref:hypothetical protein n=1 Tax=Streptomyces sp. Tu 2975 TaxID=2676871 RepID=UPI0032667627
MIELERPSAASPEVRVVEEDPAGYLRVAQLDASRYPAVREPECTVDAKGRGRQSGKAGAAEVELAGLRPVEVQGVLEVAGGKTDWVVYLCVLELEDAGDPRSGDAQSGRFAGFG